jgi:hypothetical protein
MRGSLPPSAAKRRALSRAMRASKPALTTAVFSAMPLSRVASRSRVSSIFSVVLICINMHYRCIQAEQVKRLSIPGKRSNSTAGHGSRREFFKVTATATGGAPHTIHLRQSSVTVGGRSEASLDVTLSVPAVTVGSTHDAAGNDVFQEVADFLTFTPASPSMNHGIALQVPYYLVPRARSVLRASTSGELSPRHPQGVLLLANRGGAIAGNADFYAWGLSGTRQRVRFFDVRAVGVQTNPVSATDSLLVFAVNTFDRFSSPLAGEFDVLINTDGDNVPDYDVIAADLGFLTAGSFDGEMVVAVVNLDTGAASINFFAGAPSDGSTVLIPVYASMLRLSPSRSSFSYQVNYFNDFDTTSAAVPGTAIVRRLQSRDLERDVHSGRARHDGAGAGTDRPGSICQDSGPWADGRN